MRASVRCRIQTDGVRIEVETIDEIPTVFGMRVREFLPSALRFGNGNVDGRGLYLAGNLQRGFAIPDGPGGRGYGVPGVRRTVQALVDG
jgi:hypothetical protein